MRQANGDHLINITGAQTDHHRDELSLCDYPQSAHKVNHQGMTLRRSYTQERSEEVSDIVDNQVSS